MRVKTQIVALSVAVTWPAALAADELPGDGALNGKADDFVTAGIVTVLLVGLLAAGWLRPLWAVLAAVLIWGAGVPILYEALRPTECPAGISGMDCLPVSFAAVFALPALVLVLAGRVGERVVRSLA